MKIFNIIASLLAIAVLGSLLFPTGGCGVSRESGITRSNIQQISIALELYKLEYSDLHNIRTNSEAIKILSGENPKKIRFFIPIQEYMKNGEHLDAWQRPLLIRVFVDSVEIRSAGEDAILFTKDDIIEKTKTPNQAPEPMPMSVTDAAAQPPRQPQSWLS
jgi:hypothetical protein